MMMSIQTPQTLRQHLLLNLFTLRGNTEPVSIRVLARLLDTPEHHIHKQLSYLERRGLVDAERLTLTLKGLSVAVSLQRHIDAVAA